MLPDSLRGSVDSAVSTGSSGAEVARAASKLEPASTTSSADNEAAEPAAVQPAGAAKRLRVDNVEATVAAAETSTAAPLPDTVFGALYGALRGRGRGRGGKRGGK